MPYMLASAGVSAVAGLIGASSQRKAERKMYNRQVEQQTVAAHEQRAYLDQRYREERADAIDDQINSLPRLRISAERAGFNPLSALSSGGGGFGQTGVRTGASSMGSFPQPSVAPLSSTAIITNAVAGIADAWINKRADDANRAKVTREIWERQIEKERAGGAGETIRRTVQRAGVADLGKRAIEAAPVSAKPGMSGPFDLWNVLPASLEAPTVEKKMPENVRREHVGPMWQSFTRKDGSILEVPVMPDPEEIGAGYLGHFGPETYEELVPLAQGARQLILPSLNTQGREALRDGATHLKQWYDGEISPAKKKAMDDYRQGIPSWMRN